MVYQTCTAVAEKKETLYPQLVVYGLNQFGQNVYGRGDAMHDKTQHTTLIRRTLQKTRSYTS